MVQQAQVSSLTVSLQKASRKTSYEVASLHGIPAQVQGPDRGSVGEPCRGFHISEEEVGIVFSELVGDSASKSACVSWGEFSVN